MFSQFVSYHYNITRYNKKKNLNLPKQNFFYHICILLTKFLFGNFLNEAKQKEISHNVEILGDSKCKIRKNDERTKPVENGGSGNIMNWRKENLIKYENGTLPKLANELVQSSGKPNVADIVTIYQDIFKECDKVTLYNQTSFQQCSDIKKIKNIPQCRYVTSQNEWKHTSEDILSKCSLWTLISCKIFMHLLSKCQIFNLSLRFIFFTLLSSSRAFELRPTTMLYKQAVVGHSVHLPCELPRLPDNPSLILWYKNHNTKPFYSFDARENSMIGGQHKVHDQFELGRRANFSYNNVPYATKVVLGHLMIRNITLEDAGNFTCRVDFQKAQTAMSMLQLEVLEPIWRLSVVNAHEKDVDKETVPYEEGERLYLTCKAFGGYPMPVVDWLSGIHVIASSSPFGNTPTSENRPLPLWENGAEFSRSISEVEAVLQLPALKREDQGRTFTCRANNSNLTPVRTKTIILNMSLRPVHIEIEGPSGPLWSGKEAQFQCRSWGSRPPAKLKWGPDSLSKLLNHQTSLDQNMTLSRVELIPTPEDDGRSINCTAINPLVPHYTLSTAKKLVIHYAPQVEAKLASFLIASNIKEGDDVYFECQVKANPKPRSLVWLHEGKIIEQDRDQGILVQGHNLVLQTVSRMSRGKFQCKASNTVATVTSEPVVLDVMFIPECSEPQNLTVSVSADEEIRLNCSVEAYPQPVEFIWRLNGSNGWESIDPQKIANEGFFSTFLYSANAKRQPISMFVDPNLQDGMDARQNSIITKANYVAFQEGSSLHFRSRSAIKTRSYNSDHAMHSFGQGSRKTIRHFASGDTYAVVYCLARNSVGRQKDPCIFNISPAGPPGDLVSCSLVNQSATTLGVSCIPGHDGGLQQRFRARVLDEGSRRVVANVTSSTADFYVTGLASGRDYLVIVSAFNHKGSSQPYVLEGFALKVAENKINEHSSPEASPLLGVFVGVVAGFVLVISVLILLTRARCRRRLANSERVQTKKISGGDEDLLSPSSNPSLDGAPNDANEEGTDERDACLQAPDLTAQTPDSLGSITTPGSEGHQRREGSLQSTPFSRATGSTPPPLLGLSNTYGGGGGLPRTGSSYGIGIARESVTSQHNSKTTTLPRHAQSSDTTLPRNSQSNDIQQPLHSVDLTRVTSNANKYYTLKINCTRQSNESFV